MRIDQDGLSEREIAEAEALCPRAFRLTTRERVLRILGWIAFVGLIAYCVWRLDLSPIRIWNGLHRLGWLLQFMFPPSHGGTLGLFVHAMLETLAMAFLGTLLAAIGAVPLGFLGAKNVIPQWVFHVSLRRFFDGLRAIDTLVWALIFVSVVGLGPFAGVLAIAFGDLATLAKLFAEAIENTEKDQVEGVRATGADRVQTARFAILPQVAPIMLSNVLYFFESNVRSATILGIVGAGGIGMQLADRIRVNNWDEVCFLIVMILVTVAVIDIASREVRMRLVRDPELPV